MFLITRNTADCSRLGRAGNAKRFIESSFRSITLNPSHHYLSSEEFLGASPYAMDN